MYERTNIYYWKCDREDAFHGTSDYQKDQSAFLTETIAFDCSRKHGFAWQILPYLPYRDLNVHVKDRAKDEFNDMCT